MMRFIKTFVNYFATITTAILIVCALNIQLTGYESLDKLILWQIIFAGAVTAFVTAVFFLKDIKSMKQYIIVSVIHYLCLCAIMIFFGMQFGWIGKDVISCALMAVMVAVVYAMTFLMNYILQKKEADEINKALRERNKLL